MMIFRILCGEWIEPLWDCMRAEGKVVSFFWIHTILVWIHTIGSRIVRLMVIT